MYKVLIAEDEILVRLGLANSIPWEKLGMVLAVQAANGVQAYEQFLQERPEIVITDIRMPLMDGMELIRKIRQIDTSCKIIIITCVEEFEYARQAISFQVEDYILKLTMNMEEIEAILARIRDSLDESRSGDSLLRASVLPELSARRELYDCLCGYGNTPFPFNSMTEPFFSGGFRVAFIRILLTEGNGGVGERQRDQVCTDKSLHQLLQQKMEHNHAVLIEKIPGDFFLLFQDEAVFQTDFQEIAELTRIYYNSRPVCGISPYMREPEGIGRAVRCAQDCLLQYFFEPEKSLFEADKQQNPEEIREAVLTHVEEIFADEFAEYFHTEEMRQEYADLARRFLYDYPADSEHIRQLFYRLGAWLQDKLGLKDNELSDNCVYNYRRYIFSIDNIQDIYYIFRQLMNKLLSLQDSENMLSREMVRITRYIDQHYAENLTLDELASYVNYSRGYICSLFRKEMNSSFGIYLTKVRITHAKHLLDTTFLKLYEVAEQTGFYDYSHFVKTFRKMTGISPQEYRNQQRDEMQEDQQ